MYFWEADLALSLTFGASSIQGVSCTAFLAIKHKGMSLKNILE